MLQQLRDAYPWPVRKPKLTEEVRNFKGWGCPEPLLDANLTEKTRLVVELGSFLGQSARYMVDHAPNATVICIDHWKGSEEHQDAEYSHILPGLYEGFLASCWAYKDRIIPVRETTLDGLQVVSRHGLEPDLIFVDAAHDYESVAADISLAFELFPKATLVCDDYGTEGYHGVWRAVNHFAYRHGFGVQVCGRGCEIIRNAS